MIAGPITIEFAIGGGSATLRYLFFATVEVACAGLIAWYAWKWPAPQGPSLRDVRPAS